MKITVTITQEIPDERIRDLMCCGFEGGVGYWCCITGYEFPEGKSRADVDYPHLDTPFIGGRILVEDAENVGRGDDAAFPPSSIGKDDLERGMKLMAEKYPRHFQDFVSENDDAETGDVFLQCCVLGEVVFG